MKRSKPLTHTQIPLPAVPPCLFGGTSGWAYPTWKPGFYPPGLSPRKFLEFYASQLNSVEVNYTFRTLPSPDMLAGWLAQTGPGFRFSFKAPQRITHFARLRDCEAHIAAFLAAIAPAATADKLGLLLFQLPPNFKSDLPRLHDFLQLPALRSPSAPPIAFEFRHDSWFADDAIDLLRQHNAALCIAENENLQTPEVHTSSTHTAFRLRNPGGYTPDQLAAFAARLLPLTRDRDVYVYFKHEDEPTGALNAASFLRLASTKR